MLRGVDGFAKRSMSPESAQEPERKRQRGTLSCFDCRRRKLKCGRETPSCLRCVKSGYPERCTYEYSTTLFAEVAVDKNDRSLPGPNSHRPNAAPPSDQGSLQNWKSTPSSKARDPDSILFHKQSERMARLEKRLAMLEGGGSEANEQNGNIMMFRGKGFKTQYYGTSNPASAMTLFPELRAFMKDAATRHPTFPRIRTDMEATKSKWKKIQARPLIPSNDVDLLKLVPSNEALQHSVELYFDVIESTHRILHKPTFFAEYTDFLQSRQSARPGFVAVLLLILATAACIPAPPSPSYTGGGSAVREAAVKWILASEAWLQRQSQKHLTITVFQVHCLVILAKRINLIKEKQTWTVAGNMLRIAMAAGLHRDPSLLGEKISVFDQEMRRRIWATMVEFELQASLDRGMPPSAIGIATDCPAPLNVDDSYLEPSLKKYPTGKSQTEETGSSFIHLAQSSLRLRLQLCALINERNTPLPYEDVLYYSKRISDELNALPQWVHDQEQQRTNPTASVLLRCQLQQYLLLIHGPYAVIGAEHERYSYSRIACLNVASEILEMYDSLEYNRKTGLTLLRTDVFRAAFSICHTIYAASVLGGSRSVRILNTPYCSQLVRRAMTLSEERVIHLGRGLHEFWLLSAAYALCETSGSSKPAHEEADAAVDRVNRLCYKLLALQEPLPAIADAAQVEESVATTDDSNALLREFDTIDYTDLTAWNLDDLWSLDSAIPMLPAVL